MHGLVSLLDKGATRKVEALWQKLEQDHGLTGIQVTPIPHFSWQIAAYYDWEQAQALLDELAQDISPFSVRTAGLGLFSGKTPVLYLALIKDRILLEIQALLWQTFVETSRGASPNYHADAWMPHITLAQGDLTPNNVGKVMEAIAFEPFIWTLEISTLALVRQNEGEQARLEYQVNLSP